MDTLSLTNISKLHPALRTDAIQAWEEAQAEMPDHIKIQINSTLRTFDEQQHLYNLGRTVVNTDGKTAKKPMGNIVTNAKPGSSYHNYGLAFDFHMVTNGKMDWVVGPNWMKVVAIMKKHGWSWGGDWRTLKDYPHFEKAFGHSVSDLLAIHNKKSFISQTNYVIV